jgi:hypothetical protein
MFLIAVALACLLGCRGRSAAIPEDSFRLTVADLLSFEDEHIAVAKIQTRQNQIYSVRANSFLITGGSSQSVVPAEAATDPHRQQAITLFAYRHPTSGEGLDYYKTIIKTEYGNTYTDPRWLRKSNSLSQVVRLTARDGIYPLFTPVVIGSLDGEDLLLTVGDKHIAETKR